MRLFCWLLSILNNNYNKQVNQEIDNFTPELIIAAPDRGKSPSLLFLAKNSNDDYYSLESMFKIGIDLKDGTPNTLDPLTVSNLAKMTANAYLRKGSPHWYEFFPKQTTERNNESFGWDRTGVRGHLYVNEKKNRVIVAFKGTSTLLMGGGTVARDRLVDNMMFSCCCARIDLSWSPVCDCYLPGRRCQKSCLQSAVSRSEANYYEEALAITQQVQRLYPKAQLWFIGHSLGGALASLMARTLENGAAVTFAAPGDSLFAERISLSSANDGNARITHFGISSDPIYEGACQGPTSICYLSGYAMESKCRVGRECRWNLNNPINRYDINTHRMQFLLERVIDEWRQGRLPPPQCKRADPNCKDCPEWKFI